MTDDDLEAELDEARELVAELEAELGDARRHAARARERAATLADAYRDRTHELTAAERRLEDVREDLRAAREDADRRRRMNERDKARRLELEQQLAELTDSTVVRSAGPLDGKAAHTNPEADLELLRSELDAARTEIDRLRADLEAERARPSGATLEFAGRPVAVDRIKPGRYRATVPAGSTAELVAQVSATLEQHGLEDVLVLPDDVQLERIAPAAAYLVRLPDGTSSSTAAGVSELVRRRLEPVPAFVVVGRATAVDGLEPAGYTCTKHAEHRRRLYPSPPCDAGVGLWREVAR